MSVGGVGNTQVILTVSPTLTNGETVTLGYVPGAAPIQDVGGNDAASLTTQALVNTTAVSSATGTPTLDSASDTGTSNVDTLTNDTTPTINVTCTAGATVQLREGSIILASGTCGVGNTIALTSSALLAGLHAFTTRQDTGTGFSVDSPTVSLTLDTTAPNAPTIDSVGGDTTVPYLFNGLTPGSIVVETSPGDTAAITGWTCTPSPATSTTVTCTSDTALTDGTQTVQVTLTDASGNTSANTGVTFTRDSTPPTFTMQFYSDASLTTTLADNASLEAGVYYVKITSNEALASVPTISIDAEGTNNDVSNVVTVLSGVNQYSYTYTVIADAAAVGTTLADISVTGTDIMGNVATNVAPINEATKAPYTDTTAPSTPVSAPVLQAASDSGSNTTDGITIVTTPTLNILCTGIGNIITLKVDGTANGTHTCTTV